MIQYVRHNRKYGNRKVTVDGITFDSQKEARRYTELMMLQRSGAISDLQRQVVFPLIPVQREADTVGKRGGVRKGKVIELPCSYIADFVYNENGKRIVEDVKGDRTPEYVIKRKLMLFIHGIRIRET